MRSVVITDVTSNKAIIIARFLKTAYRDIRVITCDHRPSTTLLHTRYSDRHVIVPNLKTDPEGYMTALASLVQSERAEKLIPTNSSEIRLLITNKVRFHGALDYCGDPQTFVLLDAKDKLQALAIELGLKAPRVYASVDDVDGPVVVKPVSLSGSKGVQYFQGRHDVRAEPGMLIQQRVDGAGVGYSVFVVDGEIKAGHGHIRLAETPASGGSSTYRDEFFIPDMRRMAETIMQKTHWSGFAMLEFKWNGSDLYLIEINPRIWGSVYQGLANGTNYFEAMFGPGEVRKPERPIATYFSPLFYVSLLGYLRTGKTKPILDFVKNTFRNRADVSFLTDPLGFASMAVR